MTPDSAFENPVQSASRDEFQDVFDYASRRFGPESDAARLLGARVAEIDATLAAERAANASPEAFAQAKADRQNAVLSDGLMKSPVLLVGLGVAVAAAMMGFSTLFIGMLAAKWLTF